MYKHRLVFWGEEEGGIAWLQPLSTEWADLQALWLGSVFWMTCCFGVLLKPAEDLVYPVGELTMSWKQFIVSGNPRGAIHYRCGSSNRPYNPATILPIVFTSTQRLLEFGGFSWSPMFAIPFLELNSLMNLTPLLNYLTPHPFICPLQTEVLYPMEHFNHSCKVLHYSPPCYQPLSAMAIPVFSPWRQENFLVLNLSARCS